MLEKLKKLMGINIGDGNLTPGEIAAFVWFVDFIF